ncbi:MAG: hypothetical protein KIS63_17110 [Caldilineales bacterium]|uniref:hypothetical protein n=1 Tax=Dokdonella sp. TaxID=2291710 RepID=UPI0025BD1C0E|nr:hypothetical protein [Dokdonella sp.]MBX3691029.1 hypothetical protein [Dokdonella sp.]MCW5860020.1 hypothetical protein [Caldilineales bacterium]
MPILHWLTRDEDVRATARVPYRLLEEASVLSAGDPAAANILIQGDNLDALKALLPFYAGQAAKAARDVRAAFGGQAQGQLGATKEPGISIGENIKANGGFERMSDK